jgi:hypothetical protein
LKNTSSTPPAATSPAQRPHAPPRLPPRTEGKSLLRKSTQPQGLLPVPARIEDSRPTSSTRPHDHDGFARGSPGTQQVMAAVARSAAHSWSSAPSQRCPTPRCGPSSAIIQHDVRTCIADSPHHQSYCWGAPNVPCFNWCTAASLKWVSIHGGAGTVACA